MCECFAIVNMRFSGDKSLQNDSTKPERVILNEVKERICWQVVFYTLNGAREILQR